MNRVAKRAEYIEIRAGVSWAIGGDLWVFPGGGQLAVGAATDLDGDPQTVSAQLASDMIRAGKAEAVSIVELDAVKRKGRGLELVRVDAEEAA